MTKKKITGVDLPVIWMVQEIEVWQRHRRAISAPFQSRSDGFNLNKSGLHTSSSQHYITLNLVIHPCLILRWGEVCVRERERSTEMVHKFSLCILVNLKPDPHWHNHFIWSKTWWTFETSAADEKATPACQGETQPPLLSLLLILSWKRRQTTANEHKCFVPLNLNQKLQLLIENECVCVCCLLKADCDS